MSVRLESLLVVCAVLGSVESTEEFLELRFNHAVYRIRMFFAD